MDLRVSLLAHLRRLPVRQRTVILLRFWGDLSIDPFRSGVARPVAVAPRGLVVHRAGRRTSWVRAFAFGRLAGGFDAMELRQFIGLLVMFEATVGVLILSSGRRTQLGLAGAIAFHLALWLFGWIEAVWVIIMVPVMVLLLRAERRAAATPAEPISEGHRRDTPSREPRRPTGHRA